MKKGLVFYIILAYVLFLAIIMLPIGTLVYGVDELVMIIIKKCGGQKE